jgi:hypothetical protein
MKKLTHEQKQALIEALIEQAIDCDIQDDGQMRYWLLRNGCKGFDNMTDEELIAEAGESLLNDVLEV